LNALLESKNREEKVGEPTAGNGGGARLELLEVPAGDGRNRDRRKRRLEKKQKKRRPTFLCLTNPRKKRGVRKRPFLVNRCREPKSSAGKLPTVRKQPLDGGGAASEEAGGAGVGAERITRS
jgi:hypothetical protein